MRIFLLSAARFEEFQGVKKSSILAGLSQIVVGPSQFTC